MATVVLAIKSRGSVLIFEVELLKVIPQ
jgi:hypothetical protein